MPSLILLLRHAEKPNDDRSTELSLRGKIRAAALAVLLPARFGAPTHLIATKPTSESNRPALTLWPLGQALGLAIDTRFENKEYPQLVRAIAGDPKYQDGTIIICWHHGTIPELARELGASDVPDHWGDDVFDRIWILEGVPGPASLKKIRQELLFGDEG